MGALPVIRFSPEADEDAVLSVLDALAKGWPMPGGPTYRFDFAGGFSIIGCYEPSMSSSSAGRIAVREATEYGELDPEGDLHVTDINNIIAITYL
jgi:hypothetical protein